MDITLTLDDVVLERLNAAIEEMKQTPTVMELGVQVTHEMVARAALMRGLKTFKCQSLESPADTAPAEGPKPKAAKKPEPPPKPDTKVETNASGEVVPPSGWQKWSENERVPPGQEDCHDYYKRHGWKRWWGDATGETISFYWSPDVQLQELEPFPGASPVGKKVAVQKTPWGPGHIIPHGW
jgi:hypothetical protein